MEKNVRSGHMQPFIQQMIEKKLKSISKQELLHYASQYQIVLTDEQASNIVNFLRHSKLNPLLENDRMEMVRKLAQLTDFNTAKQVQGLFQQLVKQYGVEEWFM